MKECLQIQQLPKITDNKITLYYFFDHHFDDLLTTNVEKLSAIGFPQRLNQAIKKRFANKALWERHKLNLSVDLSDAIHDLFVLTNPSPPIATFELSQQLIKILNGKEKSTDEEKYQRSGLTLELRKSAVDRLKACDVKEFSSQLRLDNIRLFQFKTGFSVATIELAITNTALPHHLLLESVYALSRFNQLHWKNAQGEIETIEQKPQFSLGDLLRLLLGSALKKGTDRVFTHTFLQLLGNPDGREITLFLNKLALHYNDEYHIQADIEEAKTIQLFDNVLHVLAMEGAASYVGVEPSSPEFLCNYKNTVIEPVYLPVFLLAFHMDRAMRVYDKDAHAWLEPDGSDDKLLTTLQSYQQQLLNFDLNFFNPVISALGSHNTLYDKLFRIQKLEQLHRKLSNNSAVISKVISDEKNREKQRSNAIRNRQYCEIAQLGVAAVGYLTSFEILKQGLDARKEEQWLNEVFPLLTQFLDKNTGLISLLLASVVAIGIYEFTRSRCMNQQ